MINSSIIGIVIGAASSALLATISESSIGLIIAGIPVILASLTAMIVALRTEKKVSTVVDDVKKVAVEQQTLLVKVDGRLTQLLEQTDLASRAAGIEQERATQATGLTATLAGEAAQKLAHAAGVADERAAQAAQVATASAPVAAGTPPTPEVGTMQISGTIEGELTGTGKVH